MYTHLRKPGHRFITLCGILTARTTSYWGDLTCLNCMRAKASIEARRWIRRKLDQHDLVQKAHDRHFLAEHVGQTIRIEGTVDKGSTAFGCSSILLQHVFVKAQGAETGMYIADHVWVQYVPRHMAEHAKWARNKGKTMWSTAKVVRYQRKDGTRGIGLAYRSGYIIQAEDVNRENSHRLNGFLKNVAQKLDITRRPLDKVQRWVTS